MKLNYILILYMVTSIFMGCRPSERIQIVNLDSSDIFVLYEAERYRLCSGCEVAMKSDVGLVNWREVNGKYIPFVLIENAGNKVEFVLDKPFDRPRGSMWSSSYIFYKNKVYINSGDRCKLNIHACKQPEGFPLTGS